MGYSRLTVQAIYRFHKTSDSDEAVRYLTALAGKYHLSNTTRLATAEEKLGDYISWFRSVNPVVVMTRINVRLPLGDEIFMAGEVTRLDIDIGSGGYRAVLLTDKSTDWKSELRMPLLQVALASRFQREVHEVAIGVQHLDGSNMETMCFSASKILKSRREAIRMARIAADELARIAT
jgi:hypothetical protein